MSENTTPIITVKNLHKAFKLPHEQHSGIKQVAINIFNRNRGYEVQKVLNGISFDVNKGDFFGIVGRNGSGKSTLLKILAGVYTPNTGEVHINGSLTPFIELGVGFNPELTGKENIFLNGALLGFSKKEIEEMYDSIVEFAELERFMDQKLKNYSSGMYVRLAFSIAIQARSDILLLDEVLAVGDTIFQQKCFQYFNQLRRDNKTVLLVSHDIGVLRQYCTRAVLIEKGSIVHSGDIDDVANKYIEIISEEEEKIARKKKGNSQLSRRGTGKVMMESVDIMTKENSEKTIFTEDDERVIIKVKFKAAQDVEKPTFGIVVKDEKGQTVFSSNNLWRNVHSKDLTPDQIQTVIWDIPNIFNNGTYEVSPAVADTFGKEIFDSVDDVNSFKVRKKLTSTAITNPQHKLIIQE